MSEEQEMRRCWCGGVFEDVFMLLPKEARPFFSEGLLKCPVCEFLTNMGCLQSRPETLAEKLERLRGNGGFSNMHICFNFDGWNVFYLRHGRRNYLSKHGSTITEAVDAAIEKLKGGGDE